MIAIRYRIRRDGGDLEPRRIYRSDPCTEWTMLSSFQTWHEACRFVRTVTAMRVAA